MRGSGLCFLAHNTLVRVYVSDHLLPTLFQGVYVLGVSHRPFTFLGPGFTSMTLMSLASFEELWLDSGLFDDVSMIPASATGSGNRFGLSTTPSVITICIGGPRDF